MKIIKITIDMKILNLTNVNKANIISSYFAFEEK